jgi:hypothetical protein
VAQASKWRQQIANLIESSSHKPSKLALFQRFPQARLSQGGWLLAIAFMLAMLFWNWKLLLATCAGVLVMLLVYLMQEWDWQVHWSSMQRFFSGSNRQLTLAVGSGGLASFSTYMAASIWVDSDSPWIATGAILQGLGTLLTLILLVWQIISRQVNRDEGNLNHLLTELTQVDPLKRLLAVRQLSALVTDARLERDRKRTIAEYFRLMLSREPEAVIRDAILDGLQELESQQLTKASQPLKIPITVKSSARKLRIKN